MLPFLKRTQEASASGPVETVKRESDHEDDGDYDMLESAAEDLIKAIHSKDTKAVASAIRAAIELYDSEPQEG